jgi:ornithine--oxo-acid transaminase
LTEQAKTLQLTSRAFYNDCLGPYEKYATEYFGFDKLLPMNTGAEAVETAIKICRKWAYEKKGVAENQAKIVVCTKNFHGRTTTIVSFSSDEGSRDNFGPFPAGFQAIPFNDLDALDKALDDPNIAGFMVEPIQGEAGVFVPDEGYLTKAAELCKKHNALFIADEVQTGVARTGKLIACDHENVKPDILILGKAMSGGAYPISAVFADNHIMDVIKPGQHGSTFGGNPMAGKVAMAALEVIKDEKLAENAQELGELFRAEVQKLVDKYNILNLVRGKGLLNALVVNDSPDSKTAWNICVKLKDNGMLAKPTHGNIIRFAPPLVMTREEILDCVSIIDRTVAEFEI